MALIDTLREAAVGSIYRWIEPQEHGLALKEVGGWCEAGIEGRPTTHEEMADTRHGGHYYLIPPDALAQFEVKE